MAHCSRSCGESLFSHLVDGRCDGRARIIVGPVSCTFCGASRVNVRDYNQLQPPCYAVFLQLPCTVTSSRSGPSRTRTCSKRNGWPQLAGWRTGALTACKCGQEGLCRRFRPSASAAGHELHAAAKSGQPGCAPKNAHTVSNTGLRDVLASTWSHWPVKSVS